jgi:uncharacterized membrane protein
VSKRSRNSSADIAPSRARAILYNVAGFLCLLGLADATYLTVLALTGATAACGGQVGCSEVLGSAYSKVAGIPVAAFGVAGYFTAFSCAIFAAFDYARAPKFFAGAVAVLFAATLWLLYVQAFVLHSFCRYCLFSAAITFLLMGLVVATPLPRPSKS